MEARFNGKQTTRVVFVRSIGKIYQGAVLIWESVRSCFGSGSWKRNKPWLSNEGWKKNK